MSDANDIRAIEALIARQFASLDWGPGKSAGWDDFRSDFLASAPLYPAARPATQQSVEAFIDRMQTLQGSSLKRFSERMLGADIKVFGNVAIAFAACEFLENGTDFSRGVEALLLVKSEGAWRIAAQAWDKESDKAPIPQSLLPTS